MTHRWSRRVARGPARAALFVVAWSVGMACAEPESGSDGGVQKAVLELDARQRVTLDRIGNDSTLRAVRIRALFPEPDGEAIPVLFADTGRKISAGLAIVDARRESPELLWPDSVTRVWWSGPHELTFTTATGRDAYVVVNVHAAAVDSVAIDVPIPGPPSDTADAASRGRAQRFIDSLHVQPGGTVERGNLTYTVMRWIPDSAHRLAAFHVTARDSAGRAVNPSWYVTDIQSGTVTLIDQVIGPADEMPGDAGGWTNDQRWIYAKGATVHEVVVRARGSR